MADTKVNIKAEAIGRTNMHILPIEKIYIDPEWNERDLSREDVKEHIEGLAMSIAKVGMRQPLTVVARGDKIHLTDGYCRMAAVKLAIKKYGADIKGVKVIIEERGTDEADHVSTMLISNAGLDLSFAEQARVIKRLLAFGWTKQDIAEKGSKSITHVDNCITLLEADNSKQIMGMLDAGEISGRLAVDTIRKKSAAAVSVLSKMITDATEKGKKKATNRTAKGSYGQPIRTVDSKGMQWAKHGPEFFRLLEQLESAFDAADTVPDSIGDIVTWYKQYKEDKKLTASAGKKAGE